MATVTLPFNYKINVSLQPGDIVYYYTGSTLTSLNDLIKIGNVISIDADNNTMSVNSADNIDLPSSGDYIMFSKDNQANLNSLVGYYAEVKLRNDSTSEAELFSASVDVDASSK